MTIWILLLWCCLYSGAIFCQWH